MNKKKLPLSSGGKARVSMGAARLTKFLVAVGAALFAPALAQTPPDVPRSLEPSRAMENLMTAPKPKASPQPIVPLLRGQAEPENAAAIAFVFREMRLKGATALPIEDLIALWGYAPGDTVTVRDLFIYANALTNLYTTRGYGLSFAVVPEQQIEDGAVIIRIVEGFIDRVEIAGEESAVRGTLRRRLESFAEKIKASRPLKTADMERYLLLMNDLPGVEASGTLSPARGVEGGSVLRIEVKSRKGFQASAGYNNHLPRSLDRHVAGGSVQANGLLTGLESATLGGWKSAVGDAYWSASGAASYNVGAEGLRLTAHGAVSDSTPSDEFLTALEYAGRTTTAGFSLDYPLIRSRTRNLHIGVAGTISNSDSEILGEPLVRDRLRMVEGSLTYDVADAIQGVTYAKLSVKQGLAALSAEGNSRANGDPEFTALALEAQRMQPLFEFAGGQFSATLSARAQAALGPKGLFSAAECAFGGRYLGRGYDSGDIIGDHCALGGLEIAWTRQVMGGLNASLYGFVDGGAVWQKGPLEPEERRERSAASAGVGLRLDFTKRVSGVVEASHQINAPDGFSTADETRLSAGLTVKY